jgi:class 3 adenylate cyclase
VQLGRHICYRADPGQVLVSNVFRQLVAGKGFSFHQIGAAILKGFEEPVALFNDYDL